ncbi:hypothetical protein MTO96_012108 [Rhipicephalus appendiculatus]
MPAALCAITAAASRREPAVKTFGATSPVPLAVSWEQPVVASDGARRPEESGNSRAKWPTRASHRNQRAGRIREPPFS